jgi:hypothetical protein
MTLMEAINRVDSIKPNRYTQIEKIKWLSTLDGIVKAEIIDTHEGSEEVTFTGYESTSALSKKMLVPAPYDEMYIRWLEAQIDYANGEYGKYNNSITMYNAAYDAFAKYYNRMHKPISKNFTHF